MPSSEKLKISDVPKKFPYFATKRPLYYMSRENLIRFNSIQRLFPTVNSPFQNKISFSGVHNHKIVDIGQRK